MASPSQIGAKFVAAALKPANALLNPAARAMTDLPQSIAEGAKEIAQLTAWRTAQNFALTPVMEALSKLQTLADWNHPFFTADDIYFDWRTAPIKRWVSFEDFYNQELASTWGDWSVLQKKYEDYVKGKVTEAEVLAAMTQRQRAIALASHNGVAVPAPAKHAGPGRGNKTPDNISRFYGTSAAYLVARLKRDHPDVAARLAAGEFPSARAAARAAGLPVDTPPLVLLRRAWKRASEEERRLFHEEIR